MFLDRCLNPADAHRRKHQTRAPRCVAREVFVGRVDNIRDGIAYLTLFPESDEPLAAQWSAEELARKAIGKSDLFELTMTDTGKEIIPTLRRTPRQPIPEELLTEIQKLREAYSDLLTDEADGRCE